LAKRILENDPTAIENAVRNYPDGASTQQILHALASPIPLRTLQYRLAYLVRHGRLQKRFNQTAEAELMSLHEGNFARYGIRPSEFLAWRQVWDA
jgi:hypothetical protein